MNLEYSIQYTELVGSAWKLKVQRLDAVNRQEALHQAREWLRNNWVQIEFGRIGTIRLLESKVVAVELPLG